MRNCSRSFQEYRSLFHTALLQNLARRLRASQKHVSDIQAIYNLHYAHMKLLRRVAMENNSIHAPTTLKPFRYNRAKTMVGAVDDVADNNDCISVHIIAIAEHVLNAIETCYENTQGIRYSEFFLKATYRKALRLSDVLDDTRGVTTELCNLFRIYVAQRVLHGGPNSVHRSYLDEMWIYRYWNTGMGMAVETKRKTDTMPLQTARPVRHAATTWQRMATNRLCCHAPA